ncbi:MAG: cysteine desulfurase NifS [Candidatus Nealsonbacteria bacterium RBG_13_37_56]|uniref:cysteine desulfurase n=1 Tax=Candidatus Nealsonbacteria bacterium RBG_13_37_56 TaxID=1801661 RepID=A0A1G2DV99_9BACT|nr:MAG: cysteine desulfurase NifS [Candidatus Nealsonbacteria bacterium RBG_13_37_56]
MKRIYLDYAATTPVDPAVKKAMAPFFSERFGNTMSIHSFGQEAKLALEQARETVANLMGAKPNEIIFTGSATESNNLALKGIIFAKLIVHKNQRSSISMDGLHIIISAIEHPCIMETANWLEKQGVKITRIPVDKEGLVNPLDIKKAITKETVLVSIIHGSNEIGTVQPIKEIGLIIKSVNHKLKTKIYFHTDAVQSFGKIPIDVNKMNIDLLTTSSHKIYGPKGAACLFVREGVKIEPILRGGGQEDGLRSSTVNLPAIVGFAKACEIAKKGMGKESQRLTRLRDKLISKILKIPNSHLIGSKNNRLPNIVNFWFSFIEGESLVIQLDLKGIAVSTGSACSSMKLEPSYVLTAIGLKPEQAHGSLRISLGRQTKESDLDYLVDNLFQIIKKLREISPYK